MVPILSSKHLNDLPLRVLRFRLRMAKFDYSISHVPGKLLYTADALSRTPIPEQEPTTLQKEVEVFVRLFQRQRMIGDVPTSARARRSLYAGASTGQKKHDLTPYWKARDSLTICNDLLLYNSRIVVPKSLQQETLQKIHSGHLGIEICKKRTVSSVWWPGVMQQVTQLVQNCSICVKESRQGKEPLITSELPKYPWQTVGTDLFELNNNKLNYLLVVDYFSRYPEVIQLTSTTSASVISALKSVFLRHGIPEIVRSDNGMQYPSSEFMSFASSYGLTSSPKYPQSNGHPERSVQTVNNLLKKLDDPYTSLLSYRTTLLHWCNLSPSEIEHGEASNLSPSDGQDAHTIVAISEKLQTA